jgi:hypothetical protein
MVHVAPLWRSREDEVEDRPCYPCFAIFYVLGPRGICLLLRPINKTLEGWSFLSLLLTSFSFLRLERVCRELYF